MSARPWLRLSAATCLALIWAGACGGDSEPERRRLALLAEACVINSDCKSPLYCVFRKCHEQCAADVDCPLGQLCVTTDQAGLRVCQLPSETACAESQDCQGKQVCARDARCRDHCSQKDDCGPDQTCAVQGACANEKEVDPEGNLPPPADAGSGGAAGSGGSAATGGMAGTGGTAATGGTAGGGGADASTGGTAGTAGTAGVDAGSGGSAGADASTGGSGGGCSVGTADCDKNGSCETDLSTTSNCGACGNACTASNASVTCAAQACAILQCVVGYGDCDGQYATGCEAALDGDAKNCGKCGRDCGGGTCNAGQCTAASMGSLPAGTVRAAVTTADHLWVLSYTGAPSYTLVRFPKSGTGAQTVDTVAAVGYGIATDQKYIYVSRSTDGIERYDVATGQPDAAWGATTASPAYYLDVRGSALYWVTSNGAFFTAPKSTGTPQLPLAPAPGSVNIANALGATATGVYALLANTSWYATPIVGGTAQKLALTGVCQGMTVASDAAYCAVYNEGIYRHVFDLAKSTQDPPMLVHPQVTGFNALATDGPTLFYLRSGDTTYTLYSVPATGGNVAALGTIPTGVDILAVDAQFAYVRSSTNTVYRLAK